MYVDAYWEKKTNLIHVVERINGERLMQQYPAKFVFYYEDPRGKHKNIFGDSLSKFESTDETRFRKELAAMRGRKIYEDDINPIFRCLEENYLRANLEAPELHIGFLDIEVNFTPDKGFASTDNPYAEINAISIHLSWLDTLYSLVLKPETMTEAQAIEVVRKFPNTLLCKDEKELLLKFLDLIENVDVLSGWNSAFFDIPYIIERIRIVLGKDYLRKICLWDLLPQKRTVMQFGREQLTYDLVGRNHLDYLELYKKHALQKKHSYRLDFIGEEEVGEKKIAYEGTLDQLFRKDFYRFIEYNRQDTYLLVKIDRKNKFIELANQIAHTNGVLLKTTLGSVGLIDQAIVNEAHLRGMVVHSRKTQIDYGTDNTDDNDDDETDSAAGAYVADPKVGLHNNIGAVDINSLYPSTIRALNMCTETLVGQVVSEETDKIIAERIAAKMSKSDAWHNMFGTIEFNAILDRNEDLEVCIEIGNINEVPQKHYMTAAEAHDFIFNSDNLCISANGTIFRTDFEGVIPGLLTKWYKERQQMQKQKKWCAETEKGIEISKSLEKQLKDM
jgi:DNA polymerase elongation subunit (family B)